MENCAMREPKLQINLWGFKIDAQGVVAIFAALLIVFAALAAWRFLTCPTDYDLVRRLRRRIRPHRAIRAAPIQLDR